MHARYAVAPTVIHEVFDDEVIVADLERGTYYSLGGSGVHVWAAIRDGIPLGSVVDALAAAGGCAPDVVAADVERLTADLVREELITPVVAAIAEVTDVEPRGPVVEGSFVSPTFEKFTDMQQMLLLDPIHDVDESGWPVPREQA